MAETSPDSSITPKAPNAPNHAAASAPNPIASPSFRPLYDQIKILLTQGLIAGEWKPGEAIPSEMDLAARYQVSQGTVRKAIDALAAENILIRRQGKGTYVATHTEPKHQYRFLRIIPDRGEKHHPKTAFIDVKRGKANGETARALDIKPGAPVTSVRRVLVFAGRPLILDEVVLPTALFPNLTIEKIQESRGSIYSFLETNYGMRMIRAEERLRAVAADAFAARHLAVAVGTPLLCVDRIAFTYGDRPVEWRRGLCHTDGYSYYNELA
jgi:GntR family transcriptional regulator